MLTRLIKRPLIQQARQFAAINANSFNLDSINPADIHDSDLKAVGAVVKAIQVDGADRPALCDEVDEYFRKNFRKIEFEDAK